MSVARRPSRFVAVSDVAAPLEGAVTTFLGFMAMLRANSIGTTGRVSVIDYCVPVLGVLGGVVFFGDAVTVH